MYGMVMWWKRTTSRSGCSTTSSFKDLRVARIDPSKFLSIKQENSWPPCSSFSRSPYDSSLTQKMIENSWPSCSSCSRSPSPSGDSPETARSPKEPVQGSLGKDFASDSGVSRSAGLTSSWAPHLLEGCTSAGMRMIGRTRMPAEK
jgi:hypothetical protein